VIAFSAGVHLDGGRLWVGTALLLLSGYFLQVVTSARSPGGLSFGDVWISPMVIIGGPMLAGVLLRRSRRQTEQLRRLTAELDGEREKHAQAAATEERNRIARELHDVISHSVSVMVVQAGAAEQLLPGNEPAREQVHAVRETGKEALAELRRQLGVLRDGQPEGPAPLPGLPELPALVQAAGARFTLEDRSASPVAPGVGLAVYRVVQEALTNARRHASGAPVSVWLRHDADGIDLVVEDEGGTGAPVGDGGNGLPGMRERVQMYGGQLEAGPNRGTPGWRVHASLPLVDRAAP
jgi:signal transduction histidine kinase